MDVISLKNVFKQSEDMLKSQLQDKCLPRDYQEVQKVINEHITKLLSENNEFKSSLNASDAELLNSVLRLSLSFQKLSFSDSIDFVKLSTIYEYDIKDTKINEDDILTNTITLLPTVISAFFSPWLAIAIGGATVIYKRVRRTPATQNQTIKRKIDISKPITTELLSEIINTIENICQEIDSVISKIKRDRIDLVAKYKYESDSKTLEKMYPQILTGIQYLIMENIKTGQKNQNVESLIFQLGVYGYKVLQYTQENSGFFSCRVKFGIETPEMYLPAIVKENEDGNLSIAVEGVLYVPQQ